MYIEQEIGIVETLLKNPTMGPADAEKAKAELSTIAFTTVFTSAEIAKQLINDLNALSAKVGGDDGVRNAARQVMERLIGELDDDEEEGLLDDDKKAPALGVSDDNDADDENPDDAPKDSKPHSSATLSTLDLATKTMTRRHTPLTRAGRTDLLMEIAETGPTPGLRKMAMDRVITRVEDNGATEKQKKNLIRMGDSAPDPDVRNTAMNLYSIFKSGNRGAAERVQAGPERHEPKSAGSEILKDEKS